MDEMNSAPAEGLAPAPLAPTGSGSQTPGPKRLALLIVGGLLLFGLGMGGGYLARSGEVSDQQDSIAALKSDLSEQKEATAEASAEAEDNMDRAISAEDKFRTCQSALRTQIENVITLLDVAQNSGDNPYLALLYLDDVKVDDPETETCTNYSTGPST